jgi:hypothetical protein
VWSSICTGEERENMNAPGESSLARHALRFGMFMGPFHATNLDPTYALEAICNS